MNAYLGETCHNPTAPLWFERPFEERKVKALSNGQRQERFAERCETALRHLTAHPMTHYGLAGAMGWNGSATWRVLCRLEEQSLIERLMPPEGTYGWIYRSAATESDEATKSPVARPVRF